MFDSKKGFFNNNKTSLDPGGQRTKIQRANRLLDQVRMKRALTDIQASLGLDESAYQIYAASLIDTVANYLQQLPATEHSYYAQPSGWLNYTLYRTQHALTICKTFFEGADENHPRTAEQQLWAYCLFSSALLRNIGRLVSEFDIELFDADDKSMGLWQPLEGSMDTDAKHYAYEFCAPTPRTFCDRLTLSLAPLMMPKEGMRWLASDKNILMTWLGLLTEDQDQLPFQTMMARADALALTHYIDKYQVEAVKGRENKIDDPANTTEAGWVFLAWIRAKIRKGEINVNEHPLYYVPGGLILCPDMFHLFIRENPEYRNWLAVQMSFTKLGLHDVGPYNDLYNQFMCQYPGPMIPLGLKPPEVTPMHTYVSTIDNSVVKGMLIRNPHILYPNHINNAPMHIPRAIPQPTPPMSPTEALSRRWDLSQPLPITPELLRFVPELQANFAVAPQNFQLNEHFYIVNRQGQLQAQHEGDTPEDEHEYRRKIRRALLRQLGRL